MAADDNVIPFPGTTPPHSAPGSLLAGLSFGPPPRATPRLLRRKPKRVRFTVRVELDHIEPRIWRRLRLASDLSLSQLHDILQVAMGWTDSHLHHFVMGPGPYSRRVAPFLTDFDLDDGEGGIPESDVRLDEVLAKAGSRLYYEYDFGDSWWHTIRLEKTGPWTDGDPLARCTDGRRACPPEDVGGVPGYLDLLDMLEGRTPGMDTGGIEDALGWLSEGHDPDAFSVDEVNDVLSPPEPPPLQDLHPGVGELLPRVRGRSAADLTRLIARCTAAPAPTADEVEALSHRYRQLIRTVGAGITLTAAGYLPPKVVVALHRDLGMADEWIGKGNREDQTLPVHSLRTSATALGLLRKAKGRLTVTTAGARLADDPRALLRHIAARVPQGKAHEKDAGLIALLVVAAGDDLYQSSGLCADIMSALGWRVEGGELDQAAYQWSHPTMDVVHGLAGWRGSDRAALAARVLLRG